MLLCWSFSTSGYAGDENELPNINYSVIYFSERYASEVGPRPEFILQLPLGDLPAATRKGGLLPAVTLDTLSFSKRNVFWASVNGFGKIYYMQGDLNSSPQVFLPYLTVYRLMVINYRNASGKEENTSTQSWLVPGMQYAGVIKPPWTFHIDAELYEYAYLNNYRIRTGLSYDVRPILTISTVYEHLSWDIRAVQNNTNVGMKGHSDAVYVRGIYRFKKDGKLTGLNLAVSGGYEDVSNAGSSPLLEPGNVDHGGYIVEVAISGGVLRW